jgi:hypothetical protein
MLYSGFIYFLSVPCAAKFLLSDVRETKQCSGLLDSEYTDLSSYRQYFVTALILRLYN